MRRLLLLATAAFGVLYTQACVTDDDCSLNGLCISPPDNSTAGVCRCDPGWRAADCGELDLVPVERWTGYNHTNATGSDFYTTGRGNSSWGGHILQDRTDKGLFHLVIAQMSHGCGLAGWRPFSTVIRAESRTGPRGPYTYAQTLFEEFHHNPTTFWSPADEQYLMYTIGKDYPPPTKCSSTKFTNIVNVASSPDLRNWSTPIPLLEGKTNPAPWPLWTPENPTSEMLLAVGENDIYIADSSPGPYNLTVVADKTIWTEDPFLWKDKRGHWHLLVHYMIDITENNVKYPRVGAHAYARNWTGPWTLNTQTLAFTSIVEFTDGAVTTFNRRERPKLYFSEDGEMTPLYLVNGVQSLNATTSSFTLINPIGTKWQEYEQSLGL